MEGILFCLASLTALTPLSFIVLTDIPKTSVLRYIFSCGLKFNSFLILSFFFSSWLLQYQKVLSCFPVLFHYLGEASLTSLFLWCLVANFSLSAVQYPRRTHQLRIPHFLFKCAFHFITVAKHSTYVTYFSSQLFIVGLSVKFISVAHLSY